MGSEMCIRDRLDVRPADITGRVASDVLDSIGITANMNTIPFDPQPPTVCSGVRFGTPALTTRGMKEGDMKTIAHFVKRAFESRDDQKKLDVLKDDIKQLSSQFPLYKHRLVTD